MSTLETTDSKHDAANEPFAAFLAPRARAVSTGAIIGAALLVFCLTLACHLPGLGAAPLAGTEAHRALPAHHMVISGDWLLPLMFNRLYLAKPPLHLWLIALSEKIAGHGNEFVWRLPSVLSGAALNAVLCLFGIRWFGRVGGLISGFAGLSLLALWGQCRTADIDATNTLFTALTALCLVELHFGRAARTPRRALWIGGAGLAFGAALLSKGPGGLPPIAGVLIWAAAGAVVRRDRRWFARPATWMPILIGVAVFGMYAAAAVWSIHHQHLKPDVGGLSEGVSNLHPRSGSALVWAMLLPFILFASALPVSLALIALFQSVRQQPRSDINSIDPLLRALGAAVVLAWLIGVAAGMTVPRYGYVTLPLLCPLAAGIAIREAASSEPRAFQIRKLAAIIALIFFIAQIAVAAMVWRHQSFRLVLVCSIVVSALVLAGTGWSLLGQRRWIGAWGLVALIVLLAVPFAVFSHYDRQRRSGYKAAQVLRATVGRDAYVITGGMLRSQPELFWYAGVDTHLYGGQELPAPSHFPGGYWVVLNVNEYQRWTRQAPGRLSHVTPLNSAKLKGYIAWYSKADRSSPPPTLHLPHS